MHNVEKILEAGRTLRGLLIEDHIYIEKLIQSYITIHFCAIAERQDEFIEYVICQHIAFDKSREIFANILKNNHHEIYKKYKNELKFISDINEERNIVSHYLLNSNQDFADHYAETGEMVFVKFKNGTSHEVFDIKRIEECHKKFKAIGEMFNAIHPLKKIK